MNEINFKRMVLAALAMFVVWIALEILVEYIIAQFFFGQTSEEMWLQVIDASEWSGLKTAVNIVISILNCTILIWLYASLRPMYGVGVKTVLITTAFALTWIYSVFINISNMGLIPSNLAFLEAAFETIEFPVAMFVGAGVYEGREEENREAE